MSEQTDAKRLAEAERYFRRMASGCEHFGSTQMAIALMAEYDARADRGKSLELEERAHERTSAECARLEAENARLRAEINELGVRRAECGKCRLLTTIEVDSNCEQHRDKDDESW